MAFLFYFYHHFVPSSQSQARSTVCTVLSFSSGKPLKPFLDLIKYTDLRIVFPGAIIALQVVSKKQEIFMKAKVPEGLISAQALFRNTPALYTNILFGGDPQEFLNS